MNESTNHWVDRVTNKITYVALLILGLLIAGARWLIWPQDNGA